MTTVIDFIDNACNYSKYIIMNYVHTHFNAKDQQTIFKYLLTKYGDSLTRIELKKLVQ